MHWLQQADGTFENGPLFLGLGLALVGSAEAAEKTAPAKTASATKANAERFFENEPLSGKQQLQVSKLFPGADINFRAAA